jgi:predicted acylesterase/phospholipase RssA
MLAGAGDKGLEAAEQTIACLSETRHAYGRSALCLSGGGARGVYHLGVIKALSEANLLPRVISGSSAGSLIAAKLAVTVSFVLLVSKIKRNSVFLYFRM